MFFVGHSASYTNYRNMVWILYPNVYLSRLPPFGRNLDELFVEIYEVGSYQFLEFVIPRHASCGVLIHET